MNVSLLTCGAIASSLANADSVLSLHYMDYQEDDERINVGDTSLGLKLDLGVDYTLDMSVGYDSVTGASPAWQINDANSTDDYVNQPLTQARDLTDQTLLGYSSDLSRYAIKRVALVDTRKSFVSALTIRDKYRNEFTVGLSHSKESDYKSSSVSAACLLYLDQFKNRSINIGLSILDDKTLVFSDGYLEKRTEHDIRSYNFELGFTQVISPKATFDSKFFLNSDKGFLSNHYLTILRGIDLNASTDKNYVPVISNNEYFLSADSRPNARLGLGAKFSGAYQLTNWLTGNGAYRFYNDDWEITSHTIELSLAVEPLTGLFITPKVVLYQQSAAVFYRNPNDENHIFSATGFGSNDVRLGKYTATTVSITTAYQLSTDWQLDLSITRYSQSNQFSANWAVAGVNYKF